MAHVPVAMCSAISVLSRCYATGVCHHMRWRMGDRLVQVARVPACYVTGVCYAMRWVIASCRFSSVIIRRSSAVILRNAEGAQEDARRAQEHATRFGSVSESARVRKRVGKCLGPRDGGGRPVQVPLQVTVTAVRARMAPPRLIWRLVLLRLATQSTHVRRAAAPAGKRGLEHSIA